MKYDLGELRARIVKKRRLFMAKAYVLTFLIVGAFVLALLRINDDMTVLCFALEFPLFYIFMKVFARSQVITIFSREIVGENVKEYEYSIKNGRSPFKLRYRGAVMPNTYANYKQAPLVLNGSVFLKLDNGNIKEVRGLYKAHMDIYKEGDILMKPEGARFPILISRRTDRQPCPYCGEVNTIGAESCRVCRLKII